MPTRLFFCLVLLLIAIRSLEAAESKPHPTSEEIMEGLGALPLSDLMDISVVETAARYVQKQSEAPAKTIVWSREEIFANGFQTLEDLLDQTPGFFHAFNSDFHEYSVRGMNPVGAGAPQPSILFLLNGIRLNETTVYGHYYNYLHNMDNVEKVEIVFGPGGALYGLNALSAVVNIITKKPSLTERKTKLIMSQSVSSPLNVTTPFLSVESSNGEGSGVYGSLTVPSLSKGNWNTQDLRLGAVRWYEKSPWHHGTSKSGQYIPNWDLTAHFATRESGSFEIFTYRTSVEYPEFNAPWWDIAAPRTRSFEKRLIDLAYFAPFSDAEIHLNFNQHYDFHGSEGGLDLNAPTPTPGINQHIFNQVNEFLGSFQISPVRTEENRLLLGVEYSHAVRESDFLGDLIFRNLSQNRYSGYAQLENRWIPKTIITAGLRYDAVTIDPVDPAQKAAKIIDVFSAISPRLTVQHHFDGDHRLRAQVARSTRQFQLGDFTDPTFAHTNDTVDDFELDYYWALRSNLTLDTNLFYMRAPHSVLGSIQDLRFPLRGRTRFESYGVETNLNWQFTRHYRLQAGFDYAHAVTDQLKEAGFHQMLNVPTAMLQVSVQGPVVENLLDGILRISGNFDILHVDDLSGANRQSTSYYPVDFVFSSAQPLKPLTFNFGVTNIFNSSYAYPGYGYQQPFQPWNLPDHMNPDSRVVNPGLGILVKLGAEFTF